MGLNHAFSVLHFLEKYRSIRETEEKIDVTFDDEAIVSDEVPTTPRSQNNYNEFKTLSGLY